MSQAIEYTATTSDLIAPMYGVIKLDYIAGAYGTVSIDEWIDGAYRATDIFTFTEESHKLIALTPQEKYRLTITGGTSPVVKITPMPWESA